MVKSLTKSTKCEKHGTKQITKRILIYRHTLEILLFQLQTTATERILIFLVGAGYCFQFIKTKKQHNTCKDIKHSAIK